MVSDTTAADGTRKWLLDVGAGNAVEMVYIPEDDRGTLCISSQAGCALDCAFCSTGKQGFNRNLTTAEIVGQLWHANRALLADGISAPWVDQGRAPITNVVLMGMGEPLANYDNVRDGAAACSSTTTRTACRAAGSRCRRRGSCPRSTGCARTARSRSPSRCTPATTRCATAWCRSTASTRSRELLAACLRYLDRAPRDFVTFEYVMLDGVNDSADQARELAGLVRDVPCKFNLIPWNPFPGAAFRTSPRARILAFQKTLMDAGFVTTIRKTRGEDIDAACGQLAGRVQDRTKRHIRIHARAGRHGGALIAPAPQRP